MITITVYKNSEGYAGFRSRGHAGYADAGYDIICAAVSALTVNTVNSIESFTEDRFTVNQKDGLLEWNFEECISEKTALLMDSLVLGLQDIKSNYSSKYIKINFEEV